MIPVNEPVIEKNAHKYVLDCFRTGWVSSAGKYIDEFESKFAKYIGTRFAVTTSSGTTALQLALASLGIGPGDEVIIPDLTIISCAFAPIYLGAKPVVVDVDKIFGNIDPDKIEEKISQKTCAIMVVHLYGHPADMSSIIKIAKKYKLYIIEDTAEAHGSEIKLTLKKTNKSASVWKKAGSIGDIGCFSFYANKLITTGEGGMIVTNNERLYKKAKLLKDLAHSPKRRFYHKEIGFNFRMTNLQAALGVAQLEHIKEHIKRKRQIAAYYNQHLKHLPWLELPQEQNWAKNVYWMYAPRVNTGYRLNRERITFLLKKAGIDTRDYFLPIHCQPALLKSGLFKGEKYPVSSDLSKRGFYIPSGLAIKKGQMKKVVDAIKQISNEKIS